MTELAVLSTHTSRPRVVLYQPMHHSDNPLTSFDFKLFSRTLPSEAHGPIGIMLQHHYKDVRVGCQGGGFHGSDRPQHRATSKSAGWLEHAFIGRAPLAQNQRVLAILRALLGAFPQAE